MYIKKNILNLSLIFIALFVLVNNFLFAPNNILCYDVFGYYLYLPLKFIYNDLSLADQSLIPSILEKYNNSTTFYQAIVMPDGSFVMRYTMGLAILYAPFFFIGHLAAILSSTYPADGFSYPYQLAIFAGSIIYSLIGLWVLAKILTRFFSNKIAAVVLWIIVLATNYIVHISMYGQNANTHNYLFTAYALVLWFTILWHEKRQLKHVVLLAVVCGLMILSRPSEVVCLIIPLLWGVKGPNSFVKKMKDLFRNYRMQLILFAGILLLIGSFQFIYWKIHTGKFLFNSYGGNPSEGLDFLSPHTLEVLFSFRKGWLVYTPVMAFAIAGFYFLYKKNRAIFWALFIYFIFNLYLVSSWTCWWYAQSFSQRSLIPSYPIMAIALGYLLSWLSQQKVLLKSAGYTLLAVLTLFNIFQTIQFHRGVIHPDRMTREYYFATFGKMEVTEAEKDLLLIERSFSSYEEFENEDEYRLVWSKVYHFEDGEEGSFSPVARSGEKSFVLDSSRLYSPTVEIPFKELTDEDHFWVKASVYVYPTKDLVENPFSLVASFDYKGWPYKFRSIDSESENLNLQLNEWNKISIEYLSPEVRTKNDKLKVFFWLRGKKEVLIDDLKIEVYEPR